MFTNTSRDPADPKLRNRHEEARNRFRATRARPVPTASDTFAETHYSARPDEPPVTIRPTSAGVDLAGWAPAHRDQIQADLNRTGAVLFRDFGISSDEVFEHTAEVLMANLYTGYGDLPTARPGARVYKSTPYPEDRSILFHNESSHLNSWPRTMCFCCTQPALQGGETPIADCRQVYSRIPADLRSEFESKGLLYVRNFVDGLDVSWRQFFRTEDRQVVEERCRRKGSGYCWWGKDSLRITQFRPAVARHPETGETTFFNQVLLHHTSSLDPDVASALRAEFDAEELPRQVLFGDGTAIPDSAIQKLQSAYAESARAFSWQSGDLLLIDNMLVAHSRNPYRGPRLVLVAMGNMLEQK
ncbi:MAG TPA: TauD/TfdA family dioxygenase [Bryobacteraceae bacterium]|jgi:alpha-ketoglutarate-dependent taurine dioxygenase|nr:TauD/TfdA family dioxygenase [Bryobacteraceae bacterium]